MREAVVTSPLDAVVASPLEAVVAPPLEAVVASPLEEVVASPLEVMAVSGSVVGDGEAARPTDRKVPRHCCRVYLLLLLYVALRRWTKAVLACWEGN